MIGSKGFTRSPVSRCQKPSGDSYGFGWRTYVRRLVYMQGAAHPVPVRVPGNHPSAWRPSECRAPIRVRACPPAGRCHSGGPLSLGWAAVTRMGRTSSPWSQPSRPSAKGSGIRRREGACRPAARAGGGRRGGYLRRARSEPTPTRASAHRRSPSARSANRVRVKAPAHLPMSR